MRKNGKWVTIAREFRSDGTLAPPVAFLPCELSHNADLVCVGDVLHAYGNDLDERGLWRSSAHVPAQGDL